jgi:hypothetical protein
MSASTRKRGGPYWISDRDMGRLLNGLRCQYNTAISDAATCGELNMDEQRSWEKYYEKRAAEFKRLRLDLSWQRREQR